MKNWITCINSDATYASPLKPVCYALLLMVVHNGAMVSITTASIVTVCSRRCRAQADHAHHFLSHRCICYGGGRGNPDGFPLLLLGVGNTAQTNTPYVDVAVACPWKTGTYLRVKEHRRMAFSCNEMNRTTAVLPVFLSPLSWPQKGACSRNNAYAWVPWPRARFTSY